MKLRIETILVEDRLRDLQRDSVPSLKASIAEIGQTDAIFVRKTATGRYKLVDGLHRLTAATELGWTTIEAEEKTFPGLTEEEAELEAQLVEIDTTLARADITKTMAADLREQRVKIVLKKKVIAEDKEAEAEAERKRKEERDARAKLAKAKEDDDVKAAAKAASELGRKEQERINSQKRAKTAKDRRSAVVTSGDQNGTIPLNTKGVDAARAEVAAATGVSVQTMKNDSVWFNELGRELVRKVMGTPLDNQMQLSAMAKIKKRHDMVTDLEFKPRPNTREGKFLRGQDMLYVQIWTKGLKQIDAVKEGKTKVMPDFHSEISLLVREEKGEAREIARELERSTEEGQWNVARQMIMDAHMKLQELRNFISSSQTAPRLKTKLNAISRAYAMSDELRQWAQRG